MATAIKIRATGSRAQVTGIEVFSFHKWPNRFQKSPMEFSTNQNARSNRFWPLFRADCSLKSGALPLHRSTLIHTLTTSQNGRYHEHLRLRARRPQGESSPAREREPDSSRSARSRRPGTGASNHGFLGSIRNGRVLGRRTRRPRRCHELGTGPYGRALNPCGVHRAPRRVFRGNPSSRPPARRRTALTPPHLFPPRSIHRCSSAPPPPRRSRPSPRSSPRLPSPSTPPR